jgi:hypothetical protein
MVILTGVLFLVIVVAQYYVTEAENEYVIRGNAAVMKCKIPSFVADFVQIDAWIADDGQVHKYNDNANYGTIVKPCRSNPV